ncbi:hypothetical protein EGD00_10120 [Pectobacterium carotovorum subsp. carotovorum]|nr:hypothetical protein EGD00_10120 [Pectobacterium carotovorum subsp. carotovorum]
MTRTHSQYGNEKNSQQSALQMILITIIIIFALQQWLLAGPEGEHDIAHIASSIILASQRAGFFLCPTFL